MTWEQEKVHVLTRIGAVEEKANIVDTKVEDLGKSHGEIITTIRLEVRDLKTRFLVVFAIMTLLAQLVAKAVVETIASRVVG